MEYKFDEEWMFERSQAVPEREPWPTLGMTSSVGLRNPALTAVVFIVLAKLSGAQHPVALCQAAVACNVLAFLVLRYPLLLGQDFYLPMYLHGISFSIGAFVIFCLSRAVWKRRAGGLQEALDALRGSSEAAHTSAAAFVGYGLLLTLSGLVVWRFYLLVTFPVTWMALAYLTLRFVPQPRRLLGVLWLAQLGLSIAFLLYIHEHQGAVGAEYGRGMRWQ